MWYNISLDTAPSAHAGRGGGIASFSFIFYLYWYSYVVYFVCDSASEFGAMGSTSFLGFSTLTCFLFFLNLLFLGTCIIFFSQVLGLSLGLFYFIFLYLILGYLVTTEIRFFALKSKKEKGTG